MNFVDALLLPEHARAIAGFLTLFELRRLLLLGHTASTDPCRIAFKTRASQVRFYLRGNHDFADLACPQCFLPFIGRWEVLPCPLVWRSSFNLVELDGVLYAGSGDSFDEDGKLIKFDPRHGEWQLMPPFLIPRVGYSLVATAGRLFVVGGRHEGFDDDELSFAAPDAGECFDITTGLWYFLGLRDVQQQCPLVAAEDDRIYMCATIFRDTGMDGADPSSPTNLVECLNAHTLQWERLIQPMFWAGYIGHRHMAMLESSRGSVYVGSDVSIDRYDASMRQWQTLPPMPEELSHIDSSEYSCHGRLFICGGDSLSGYASSFGFFDPVVQHWQLLPSMPQPCASPALLSFGTHIYVFGGRGSSMSSKRFCLLRNSWEVLDDLVEPAVGPDGVVSMGFQDTAKYARRPPRMFSNQQLAASVAASTVASNPIELH